MKGSETPFVSKRRARTVMTVVPAALQIKKNVGCSSLLAVTGRRLYEELGR